ncbi:MAG: hypothetical protein AAGF99_08525 [Bacteroidota bacterium]
MPSHFSSIGLPVESEEEFVAFAEMAAQRAEVYEVRAGRYLRWASPTGAELWLHLNRVGDFVSLQPHFVGPSSLRVGVTASLNHSDDTELEGSFHGWASPDSENPESGAYPFVFSAPDFRVYADLTTPSVATAQIAAFAHEATVYSSVEAYNENQESKVKFSSQSFVPSGMFSSGGELNKAPQPLAIFTGHIIKSGAEINELSGVAFHWAAVETLGGTYDVVLDPSLLGEVPPVGGVLQGSFWLSGRLTEYERTERPSFFKRLFRS